ncbi:hypothetical protein Trydic_g221, partial [Trypoxylus dichotomus]
TNVPFDGLLGQDFLQKEKAHIDYESGWIKLKSVNQSLKMYSEINSSCSNNISNEACKNTYKLNGRSENIVEIEIQNPGIKEGIIPELELRQGIYLSKAIVKVNSNGKAYATILNTKIENQEIPSISVKLESLPPESKILNLTMDDSTSSHKSRNKLLRQNLRLEHLNPEEKQSILDTCFSYNDIFLLPNDTLTCTSTVEHEINLSDPTPIFTRSYRFPQVHKKEVDRQIEKMLKQNIIQPSASPWSSPLWVVPKKLDASGEKKWRIVIDYRKLNNVTIGDAYPLPNIEDILDQLGHAKYFTTLDLASGYHQIPMKKSDQPKTAFTTPSGQYEFTRMPFGLKTAPSVFQRLMNTVLTGLQGLHCFVYLDDIVIYASSLEQHSYKLKTVFSRLRASNLKLQPDKCEFLRREVSYLGHIITSAGVKPNLDKVNAIHNFPVPVDQKTIKMFLGLVGYYRKFIPNFAKIAKPLTSLLRKDIPFIWSASQQQSFDTFRTILTNEPLLIYPDFSQDFVLTTDASNFAIGSVLSQGGIGKDRPIAYASRTLNNAEQNYSTTEKELLSIIWSVRHFRPYLYGRKFKIVTDHKPLTWLFNCKDPGSRLVRWRLQLAEYDYEIIYKEAPMEITSTASKPFERLAIDVVGPLPVTENNNRFIFTMQDDLTKFSYAVPIPNHESRTLAIELSKFITFFGIPKSILSDQGTDFTSNLTKELTKLFQTKHLLSSPYHPQTNGALERSHLTLKDYLKHYINNKQSNWDEFIPFAMFAYNTHTHSSTGFSPYETLFGNKPYLPNSIVQEPTLNYNYEDYIINLRQKLNFTQKVARDNLLESKNRSKTYYDNKIRIHKYSVGDLVYVANKAVTPGLNKKLSPNYIGPYKITKVFGNNNETIALHIPIHLLPKPHDRKTRSKLQNSTNQ